MSQRPISMDHHVQMLGILAVVFGGFSLLGALAAVVALGTPAPFYEAVGQPRGLLAAVLFLPVIGVALAAIVCGIGLLHHCAWARMPSLIVSGLTLLAVPVGTVFGIYATWVLTQPGTEALLRGTRHAPVRHPT